MQSLLQSRKPCLHATLQQKCHKGHSINTASMHTTAVAGTHAIAAPNCSISMVNYRVTTARLTQVAATSPDAYLNEWRLTARPCLDALWSAAIRTSNAQRLLLALDTLFVSLRSHHSFATHLHQHHADSAWAAAGQLVAADCAKYERYVSSNRAVAKRLQALQQSLLEELRQPPNQQVHPQTLHNAASQQQQGINLLTAQQQLDLCHMLLPSLQSGAVEDSLQWLAALEQPDTNLQLMHRLQEQEQSLTAAIDSLLAQPVLLELPTQPDQLLLGSMSEVDSSDLTGPHHNTPSGIQAPAATSARKVNNSSSSQQPPTAEADAAGPPQPLVYSLSKGMVARLLQQCGDAAIRQQLHEAVLQPKLQHASRLLGQLARCRHQQACLFGQTSYFTLTQQRLQVAVAGNTVDLAGLCIQLQDALQPLCQTEVDWIMDKSTHQQQQQQQPSLSGQEISYTQGQQQDEAQMDRQALPGAHTSQSPVSEGPWDWAYLQHQALLSFTSKVQQNSHQLQQHLQLTGVLAGFSCLMQDLLGLQLLPRAAAAGELWASHVVVLDVLQHQQTAAPCKHQTATLLGTVYVDIGGGYGTRMLRYAGRAAEPSSSSGSGGSSGEAALPAVAVGISGGRLMPQEGQVQPVVQEEVHGPVNSMLQPGSSSARGVLSVSQLWELGHELGHALHLVASSRQPAGHLAGRFLPPHLLELPPQLMERLLLDARVVARVCCHTTSGDPLPRELADALASYYGSRYNSALAVSARVATSLAELMYGEYGADMEDYWRGAWEAASGLPAAVAAAGSLREVALMPVMAAHKGTYHCYLAAWVQAARLYDSVFGPLISMCLGAAAEQQSIDQERLQGLRSAALAVFTAHVGSELWFEAESKLHALDAHQLKSWLWEPAA